MRRIKETGSQLLCCQDLGQFQADVQLRERVSRFLGLLAGLPGTTCRDWIASEDYNRLLKNATKSTHSTWYSKYPQLITSRFYFWLFLTAASRDQCIRQPLSTECLPHTRTTSTSVSCTATGNQIFLSYPTKSTQKTIDHYKKAANWRELVPGNKIIGVRDLSIWYSFPISA